LFFLRKKGSRWKPAATPYKDIYNKKKAITKGKGGHKPKHSQMINDTQKRGAKL